MLSRQLGRSIGIPGLKLSQAVSIAGDSGRLVWKPGLLLASYISSKLSQQMKNARVLELGSGTGLVSLAAAAYGASVIATDLPDQLDTIRQNVAVNKDLLLSGNGAVEVHALQWADPIALTQHFDWILGSDLIYREGAAALLAPLLSALIRISPKAQVMLGYEFRGALIDNEMSSAFASNELLLAKLDYQPPNPECGGSRTVLYRVTCA